MVNLSNTPATAEQSLNMINILLLSHFHLSASPVEEVLLELILNQQRL